jgi:Gram-negative bacterial TonB protein C-terminal
MRADQARTYRLEMKTIRIVFILVLAWAAPCWATQQQDQAFDQCARQFRGKIKIRLAPGVISGLVLKKALPDAADMDPSRAFDIKVQVMIDETGTVKCAAGIEGDQELYERSTRTAQQWKFRPYILNGKPVVAESAFYFHYSKGKVEGKFSH